MYEFCVGQRSYINKELQKGEPGKATYHSLIFPLQVAVKSFCLFDIMGTRNPLLEQMLVMRHSLRMHVHVLSCYMYMYTCVFMCGVHSKDVHVVVVYHPIMLRAGQSVYIPPGERGDAGNGVTTPACFCTRQS